MTRRAYLAGPVSLGGTLPPAEVEANRTRFRAARERLTAEGWEVLDPTEGGAEPGRTWPEWMKIGLRMLLDADLVVMLPGWQTSKGALIEHRLASELGIPVEYRDRRADRVLGSGDPGGLRPTGAPFTD